MRKCGWMWMAVDACGCVLKNEEGCKLILMDVNGSGGIRKGADG